MNKQEAQNRKSQLEDEIEMLNNQIDILEGGDFEDTVPEKETFINAIQAYIEKAEAEIENCNRVIAEAERPAVAPASIPGVEGLTGADVISGLLKLAGILGRG